MYTLIDDVVAIYTNNDIGLDENLSVESQH